MSHSGPRYLLQMFSINQATGCVSQHIWCLSQAWINWEGCVTKDILRKNGGDGRGGGLVAPISLDGVAVHRDCWCVCLSYLHFVWLLLISLLSVGEVTKTIGCVMIGHILDMLLILRSAVC